jgi:hypothetical protein
MCASNTSRDLSLIVTGQADFSRCFSQHPGIFAGMLIVAGLAVTFLDRLVLCSFRDILMTSEAETDVKGPQTDSRSLDLVTVVAFTVSYRRMYHLSEQSRITGTMLCVTVNAFICDWVTLMGSNEPGVPRFMAGTTQIIAKHVQQSRLVCHVRHVTG